MTSRIKGLMRTAMCGSFTKEQLGEEVTLCGWVNKYRDLGGLHFVDLRDKSGLIQLRKIVLLEHGLQQDGRSNADIIIRFEHS